MMMLGASLACATFWGNLATGIIVVFYNAYYWLPGIALSTGSGSYFISLFEVARIPWEGMEYLGRRSYLELRARVVVGYQNGKVKYFTPSWSSSINNKWLEDFRNEAINRGVTVKNEEFDWFRLTCLTGKQDLPDVATSQELPFIPTAVGEKTFTNYGSIVTYVILDSFLFWCTFESVCHLVSAATLQWLFAAIISAFVSTTSFWFITRLWRFKKIRIDSEGLWNGRQLMFSWDHVDSLHIDAGNLVPGADRRFLMAHFKDGTISPRVPLSRWNSWGVVNAINSATESSGIRWSNITVPQIYLPIKEHEEKT